MEPDVSAALCIGVVLLLILRGRMVQGDIAAALVCVLYLTLLCHYSVCLHPEQGLLASLGCAAYFIMLSFFSSWACFVVHRISPFHPLHQFPGPLLNRVTELPLALAAARLDRHLYLYELHKQYGPVVRTGKYLTHLWPSTISINSKSAAHVIYKSAQCFNKTDAYDLHLKGEGLFFIKERDRHSVRRRTWNHAMSKEAIREYIDPLFRTTQAFVERLVKDTNSKGMVDLVRCTAQWAFDTSALITFGGNGTEISLLASDDPGELADKPRVSLASFDFFSHFPWLFHILKYIPSSVFRQVEEFALEQAKRRLRAEKIQFKDIFSYWIDDPAGTGHPDLDELATDSLAAIIAATETVSSMTTLVLFFVLSNPKWHYALRAELDATFAAESESASPLSAANIPSTSAAAAPPLALHSTDALDTLPVLNAIINEAFRLGAVFSGLNRVVPPEGALVDGRYLPGGTIVSVPIYAQHLSEENFGADPAAFDPARWLAPQGEVGVDRNALLTFSAGPFNCVGRRLAYTQTRLVLGCLFLLLDIEPAEGFDAARFWAGVGNLRATIIREPLHVTVRRRGDGGQVLFPSV
ncbi:cytochrome P450 [Trametes gibbosa]|nr:cytochrome P450 [Trametes gibbosa]